MKKYQHRHVNIAISESHILKPHALGKDWSELKADDIQDWFPAFWWEHSRGMGGLETDGEELPMEEIGKLVSAMYTEA